MENLNFLLEYKSPLGEIETINFVKYYNKFCRLCNVRSIDFNSIENSLSEATGVLNKLISLVLNFMKKETVNLDNRITELIYEEYNINYQGVMKQIDEEMNTKFVSVDEKRMNFAKLVSYKVFLEIIYFDVIYLPLKKAVESYQIKNSHKEFYYDWFAGVTAILRVKAGLRREDVKISSIFKGKAQYTPYSMLLNQMEKQREGEELSPLKKEYSDTFSQNFDDIPYTDEF